ncbi:TPA: plasmid recombination protein [Stenotrophomonas maltophilia]|jgi:hypothetical protein|nr:plasmid recombination protein [Stenotrophomonas maltophilia]
MAHPVIIRAKKLATLGQVSASGQHTWRERPTHNADPARTPGNQDLRQVTSAAGLRAAVEQRLATVTEKTAPKPVRCVEYLVTANHDAFRENGGSVDHKAYFRDAMAWIEKRHGAANVVAANVQLDEHTPHLVVYVVPLIETEARERKRSVIVGTNPDGTKRRETRTEQQKAGVRLSAAHYLDGRAKLSKLQTDFAAQVGQRHGLVRGVERSQAKHTTVREFYAGIEKADRPKQPIPANALEPRVIEPGGFLKKAVVESPEEVAERLTKAMRKLYAPSVAAAGGTALERKKRQQAEATAKAKTAELDAMRPLVEAMHGLPAADVASLVEQARGMQRVAQIAAEAARRAAALVKAARDASGSAISRWARWALDAIERAGGDHRKVQWDATERGWSQAAQAGRDGWSELNRETIMCTVLEHSPGRADVDTQTRQAVLAKMREQRTGNSQEDTPSRGHGPGR